MKRLRSFFCKSFLWVLLAPWVATGLGWTSNQTVLIANHDRFPVMINPIKLAVALRGMEPLDGMIDGQHCIMTSKTHLNILADIIVVGGLGTISVGDGLLFLGEWLSSFCIYIWGVLILKKLWDEEAA
jgi:hypothetical protein